MSTDDLTNIEAALARLRPATGTLQRDELLFAAGRASTQPALRFWRGLAGLATTLAVSLAVVWCWRPVRMVERVITLEVAPPSPSVPAAAPSPGPPSPGPVPPGSPSPTPADDPSRPRLARWRLIPDWEQATLRWSDPQQQQAWQIRQQVLRHGIESWTMPRVGSGTGDVPPPRTLLEWYQESLKSFDPIDQENP